MRCVQGIVLRPSGTSVYVDSSAIYGDAAFHIKTRILMLWLAPLGFTQWILQTEKSEFFNVKLFWKTKAKNNMLVLSIK